MKQPNRLEAKSNPVGDESEIAADRYDAKRDNGFHVEGRKDQARGEVAHGIPSAHAIPPILAVSATEGTEPRPSGSLIYSTFQ